MATPEAQIEALRTRIQSELKSRVSAGLSEVYDKFSSTWQGDIIKYVKSCLEPRVIQCFLMECSHLLVIRLMGARSARF